jgi:hypothetical protein
VTPAPPEGASTVALLMPEPDERLVTLLYDTMQLHQASRQNDRGAYFERPRKVGRDDVRDHLRGAKTLAFPPSRNGQAFFLALDVDANWKKMLPRLRDALTREGLNNASFATTGSDPNRGKVIITLARPVRQERAFRFLRALYTEAVSGLYFTKKQVDLRPIESGASLLRIGGRNRDPGRGAIFPDRFLNLAGDDLDPSSVVPMVLRLPGGRRKDYLRRAPSPRPHKIVGDWCRSGWPSNLDRNSILKRLTRLACNAIRCKGPGADGLSQYEGWVEEIKRKSPSLRLTTGKVRSCWSQGCRAYRAPEPKLSLHSTYGTRLVCSDNFGRERPMPPQSVSRLWNGIVELASVRGLHDLRVLSFSQREVGETLGLSQQSISKAFRKAVALGCIVVHDEGSQGVNGSKAIFGLVTEDQSPSAVLGYGSTHTMVTERKAKRALFQSQVAA